MGDTFVRVASVDEIAVGKMKRVELRGHPVLIANVDGRYFAVDDTCTHEDASLSSGSLKGELVKCPLHGSRFNVMTGEVLDDPAEQNLRAYAVRIEGQDILIQWP